MEQQFKEFLSNYQKLRRAQHARRNLKNTAKKSAKNGVKMLELLAKVDETYKWLDQKANEYGAAMNTLAQQQRINGKAKPVTLYQAINTYIYEYFKSAPAMMTVAVKDPVLMQEHLKGRFQITYSVADISTKLDACAEYDEAQGYVFRRDDFYTAEILP